MKMSENLFIQNCIETKITQSMIIFQMYFLFVIIFILMSKDYTQKIRNLLNESKQTVPEVFQRFYTVLKLITLSIRHQNEDAKIFDQYSLIYRIVKKWLVDEPSTLIDNTSKIDKELKALLNPLTIFLNQDLLSKKILELFFDKENSQKIASFINDSEKLKSHLLKKNIKLKIFGTHELSNAFWIKKFNNECAVHVDTFWNAFLEFIDEINFFGFFVSTSSKKSILKRVDPDKKYFVTSTNISQLFYKLSEPKVLEELADETAKGLKPMNFQSKDFLEMKFHPHQENLFETELNSNENFEINGQDTLIQGQRIQTKYPPTVIFGSSIDSDVRIKNKYVSRKQFMIIEEDQKLSSSKLKSTSLPFSLVCLSSSNFTMISYDRKEKLQPGMIFKIGQNSIQVVRIQHSVKQSQEVSGQEDSDDETLTYLPTKGLHSFSQQKQLQYLCISGSRKGLKGKLTKQNLKLSQSIYQDQIFVIEYSQNEFYLPPRTQILVKTANQVINGLLSDKINLQQGMRIILEDCYFEIL